MKVFCIPKSFNANISHQPFDCKINFENSQSENTKFKRLYCTQKQALDVRFKDFWYTKIYNISCYSTMNNVKL